MRRRPLTPFGSHSIEKGIIHFRRGNADNPIRPTQSPADFQQRDGRGIASALEITQGRHGHATPFRRRLKRQIRRQTRRTNARTQRLQKFLPRLIDHNCSYKDRKRAYYTTTVFTKAIVRIMPPLSRIFTRPPKTLGEKHFRAGPKPVETFRVSARRARLDGVISRRSSAENRAFQRL